MFHEASTVCFCCSLEIPRDLNFVPKKCENRPESVGILCSGVFHLSLGCAITSKMCGEAKLTANIESCVHSRPGSGAEFQTEDAQNIQCPSRGLGEARGCVAWDTIFFSCSWSLVQVTQGDQAGRAFSMIGLGYHFPGMETPHSYQPT